MTARALVLRAPGINCDRETAHACRLVGFETDVLHINHLIKAPERLLDYALLVIPGGFSYADDLGAGTLLAKNLTTHLGPQLDQFIDDERLVLGICNGFQVLVRAGLLPDYFSPKGETEHDNPVAASLTDNASAQFECRWVTLDVQRSACIFTRGIDHPITLPVAHGEGQFVLAEPALLGTLAMDGHVPLVYAPHAGGDLAYPDNPNGSIGNIAGVCNTSGSIFGLMPHPERYVSSIQHPLRRGGAGGQGDGLLLFQNAFNYAQSLDSRIYAMGSLADTQSSRQTSYVSSGVDIAAAERAKALMKDAVRATQGPDVLAGMGAFAGMMDARSIQHMRHPALVASTDGVGTKTLIAAQAGRFDTIGYDLVNHSVNDLLTQGARPLFFMDYLAMSKLDALHAATIVRGVAEACQAVGCALLGGETAEMPGVYLSGAFDLAGTIVGVVERDSAIDGAAINPGDILFGLPSSGLHTNGYSLARRIFAPYALDTVFPELKEPLVDALLRPHRCYLSEIRTLQDHAGITIKGMAHITGGGFAGNIARILPGGRQAVIETRAWTPPSLFQLLARLGQIERKELYQTFNMGIGMVLVFSVEAAEQARHILPELIPIGYVRQGNGVVLN
ncbi:MAG: phosphoribosylformylglycinamidine cyclo-ligase [Chloroflexi bacterium]|nr:MAG: phosphoribosylformylglycinamidine cyclo-ligase [Chloroflexota bacterium]